MKASGRNTDTSLSDRPIEAGLSADARSALLQLARALGRLAAAEVLELPAVMESAVAPEKTSDEAER